MKTAPSFYIEGPVSLTELKLARLGKRIYIFGDEHSHSSTCVDPNKPTIRIDRFLDQLVKATDKIIDLFLELDFPDKSSPSARDVKYQVKRTNDEITYLASPDYITDIFHLFYNCFQHDKHECRHKNLRAHYTDVRYIGTSAYILSYALTVNNTYRQIQLQELHRKLLSGLMRPPQDLKPIIKAIISDGLKILEHLPFDKSDIYATAKIDKQLKNINDPLILGAIHNYYDNRIWNSLLAAEDSFKSYTENSTMEAIKVGVNHLFDYASMLFEVYVIGRMFRTFNGKSIDNIILYLGDIHSQRIVECLKTIPGMEFLQKKVSDTPGVDNQCLDISGFRLPFFTNKD
jgi:hypothetical protein